MKKRIAALILTAVLAFGCFGCLSGCGGGGASNVLKGQVVRIASWFDPKPEAGTELGDARLERIAAAEEKYGCTVEYVTMADIFGQMTLAASSGEVLADVLMTRGHYLPPLARSDALWSMEELGDMSKDIYSKDVFENTKVDGKTYGFYYDPVYVDQVLVFNKGILERNGIPNPYDLVRQNKWTYDAWLNIMQKTVDPANGIQGCGMQQAFEATIMKGNDACIYAQKDGKWVANTSDNRVLESLSFLADCVSKYKVMDSNIGRNWDYCPQAFANGQYVFALIGVGTIPGFLGEMSEDYGIVPVPMGPSGTHYPNVSNEIKTFCIQKSVPKEKATALLAFMDEAFAYPLDLETSLESYYTPACRDRESLEMIMLVQEQPFHQVEEFTTPDVRGTEVIGMIEGCARGTLPIRSTLDSYAGQIQGMLDEYYAQ